MRFKGRDEFEREMYSSGIEGCMCGIGLRLVNNIEQVHHLHSVCVCIERGLGMILSMQDSKR